jgi:hypothetical protein
MGIDLELVDCAVARRQRRACQASGHVCVHDPACKDLLSRLLEQVAVDRPGAGYPSESGHRRFSDVNAWMRQTGMGYEAEILPYPSSAVDRDSRWQSDDEEVDEFEARAKVDIAATTAGGSTEAVTPWCRVTGQVDDDAKLEPSTPSRQCVSGFLYFPKRSWPHS